VIDVRSDTVTQPTPHMRQAMLAAEVGDDFYGLDPTVNALQRIAAQRLEKESALLMPSGTMANAAALLSHTHPGESVIMERTAHVYQCEAGHMAAIAGVLPAVIPGDRGVLPPEAIEAAVIEEDVVSATTSLIWIENTHNAGGGTCTDVATMAATRSVADKYGLRIHIDGERIFHAAVALGVSVADLVADADSVQFGLSKGLACPFGSVLLGTEAFIARARKARQMLGGGMRQIGLLAAAGLVALEEMIDRLAEDHANARALAEGLVAQGYDVDRSCVQTNIVYVNIPAALGDPGAVVEELGRHGIAVNPPWGASRRIRMVTHYGITAEDIAEILTVTAAIARQ